MGVAAEVNISPAPDAPDLNEPWAPVLASVTSTGQRRLEARSYLTDGYGQRQLIESAPHGWKRMNEVADVWQPSRLKGIVVRPRAGLPFLSAGQIFESSPVVRKWLAPSHVPDVERRQVHPTQLLMSCSGRVGRITAVYPHHENLVATHDLLRIEPKNPDHYGWLYAYMRSSQFGSIARTAQYGHMIKHLEPEHVQQMPVIIPDQGVINEATRLVNEVMTKRRMAANLQNTTNTEYEALLNPHGEAPNSAAFAAVNSANVMGFRRRLDAEHFRPEHQQIESLIRNASTHGSANLSEMTDSVSLGGRFRRYFGDNGTPYRSAEELFDLNAPVTKRVYAGLVENRDEYTLTPGWILMARSGQVYGLNGRVLLTTDAHNGIFGSDDLIRIVPKPSVNVGYLLLTLSHPLYGRPMIIRNAYGTSIPHLDPIDVRRVPIPRFAPHVEAHLGDAMIKVSQLRMEADRQENEATKLAEGVIAKFMVTHGI